jgi:4-amino-4-deoxy-L-arabinose transferase-like glycosyltransferase
MNSKHRIRWFLDDPIGQRWSVVGVVLLGLLLRLWVAWSHNQWQPNSTAWLIGDEPGYNNTALELLAGYGFTWPGRVPLYPVWLAGVHWLTGTSYHAVRYVQAFLGAGTVFLTYLLGRRLFGHPSGLIAALLASASYVLIHQSLHLLSEVLFTPVVLLVALSLFRAVEQPTTGRFAAAGIWIGISDLIRPTLLLFPFFLLWPLAVRLGWRSSIRYGTVLALAVIFVIGPWIIRNRIRYDAWFPLATSNAILWQGSPEYYKLIHEEGYTYMRIWKEVLYGPGWERQDPTSIAGDRYWTERALKSIRSDPGTYLKYAAEKLGTYWVGDANADWNDERIFSFGALRRLGFSRGAAAAVMIARALPIIALAAILVLWPQRRRLLPLYAILAYCTLLHAATSAVARLSEPLQPILLVLVAGAVVWQRRQRRESNQALPPAT